MWVIFAQTATDPISGGAGWVGAGLLGLVLGWLLLKHLPDKDRQLTGLMSDKDKQITALLTVKDEQLKVMLITKNDQLKTLMDSRDSNVKVMHEENRRSLDQVIKHCEQEMTRTNEMLQHDLNQLGESIDNLATEMKEFRNNPNRRPRTVQQPPDPRQPPPASGQPR